MIKRAADMAWLSEALANIPKSPCAYQTQEEIEQYYRNAPIGAKAAVRHTQYGLLEYDITIIERRSEALGRVYIRSRSSGSAFYIKSGKNCYHPKGQSSIVVPTEDVVIWAENNPRGMLIGKITTFP